MNRTLFGGALALCLATTPAAATDLMIQEVVDGTVNSQPTWVELINTGIDCLYLGDYELCNYNNGGTTASNCYELDDVFLAPGASYVFAYESVSNAACSPTMTCFEFVYGFAPDQNGAASINGDDALVLQDEFSLVWIDVYGEVGVDGTGEVWEYTDGYAVRNAPVPSPVFTPSEWTFGGVDSLEDPGGDPAEVLLMQSVTSPGAYVPCAPAVTSYCTAGTSASGCQAVLVAGGTPSAASGSGFTLSAASVEGARKGLFFFGTSGRQAAPWGGGSSFQCVVAPVYRAGIQNGGGTLGACDGSFSVDLNALWCAGCPKPAINPGAGTLVQAQLWYRDPLNPSGTTTSLSDAVVFARAP
jgi:hypothetical protein